MFPIKPSNDKALNAALFVALYFKKADFHKIFKILYFADQKHLANYGRTITGDKYIAMQKGPVPSRVYDIFKIIKGEYIFENKNNLSKFFKIENGYIVKPLAKPDLDLFSESDIECLNESIKENEGLDFGELKDKSHDLAWDQADKNDLISIFDIAKAGGASEEIIKYIKTLIDNRQTLPA